MERLSLAEINKDNVSTLEHRHRYSVAAIFAKGHVLDAGCGVGYGAPYLCEADGVQSYFGIDPDQRSIRAASETFRSEKAQFRCAPLESIPAPDNRFDSIVSLETLEHVGDLPTTLKEIRRVLKPEGVFVGSVPTEQFDAFAEDLWGINPYHLRRFTRHDLAEVLSPHFSHVRIFYAVMEIASFISDESRQIISVIPRNLVTQQYKDLGSFFFVASNSEINPDLLKRMPFGHGIPYFNIAAEFESAATGINNEVLARDIQLRSLEERLAETTAHLSEVIARFHRQKQRIFVFRWKRLFRKAK